MRVDHVGVAVRSIEEALGFYRDRLGLAVTHREEVAGQGVRVAFLARPGAGEGEAEVELLEPLGGGAVARFLEFRGPGLHHLAFRAVDIAGAMAGLKAAGLPALEDAPRPGARGRRVCFLHPRRAHGVLVELVG